MICLHINLFVKINNISRTIQICHVFVRTSLFGIVNDILPISGSICSTFFLFWTMFSNIHKKYNCVIITCYVVKICHNLISCNCIFIFLMHQNHLWVILQHKTMKFPSVIIIHLNILFSFLEHRIIYNCFVILLIFNSRDILNGIEECRFTDLFILQSYYTYI